MAKKSYKLNDSNVNFSIKPEVTFSIGNKILYSDYQVNENGDVTWHKPVINAIDIDWQNAVTDEITDAINTSGKLISVISNNKKSIRLTNEAISSIRTQISSIESSLESINNIIDDSQSLSELRESLRLLSERVTAIEQGSISIDLTEIQNAISSINERINNLLTSVDERFNNLFIPKSINDLTDGWDVLRGSQFEIIKTELQGESAYDIAKRLAQQNGTTFPYSNEAEWLSSLKGETGRDGTNGESAYSIAKRTAQILGQDFPYNNEIEWMTAITNGSSSHDYIDQKISELRTELNNIINNTNNLTAGEGIIIENNVITASANTWIKI